MNYFIGQILNDNSRVNTTVIITNLTNNSIEVFITASTKRGINCKQWYTLRDFEKKFVPVV